MSATIHWTVTSGLSETASYLTNIYRSITGENGTYSKIAYPNAKTGTTWIATYVDSGGLDSYDYYVKYETGGVEGDIVIAWVEETVREKRLCMELRRGFPTFLSLFSAMTDRELKEYIQGAAHSINMLSPLTSYSTSDMPTFWEPAVKLGALIFMYFNVYLQLAIKDFSYSEGGVAMTIDRGSKVNNAVNNVMKHYNELTKQIKFNDWPDPIGLGSYAIAVPSGRILSFLYNIRESI